MKFLVAVICALICIYCGCSSTPTSTGNTPNTASAAGKAYSDTLIPAANSDTLGTDSADPLADLTLELPMRTVSLDSFRMSRYEITNYEFAAVLNSAMAYGPGTPALFKDSVLVDTHTIYRYIGYKDKHFKFHADTLFFGAFPVYKVDSTSITVTLDSVVVLDKPDSLKTGRDTLRAIVLHPVDSKKDHPATQVSWYGAALYCNLKTLLDGSLTICYDTAFAAVSGTGYRLPSEDQWEHAARGGLGFAASYYPTGRSISPFLANYLTPTRITFTANVGTFTSNNFGLFDMAGNVWEWCADRFGSADSLRVIRGGSYADEAGVLRSSSRSYSDRRTMDPAAGFRVVSH